MGRTRYRFGEAPFPHFLTCTVVGWLPVFTRPETVQLWQEGSQPKMIETEAMLRQKLEYIHDNPVKRGYVSDPTHWRYSSAQGHTPDRVVGCRQNRLVIQRLETTRSVEDGIPTWSMGTSQTFDGRAVFPKG